MAEVHIIGEIIGATRTSDSGLYAKWGFVTGPAWRLLEGYESGQTHIDQPKYSKTAKWSHPIDVHYATKGVQGWPKVHFQVFLYDSWGRSELYGYGFVHVPTAPGTYDLDCVTWKPSGSTSESIQSFFIGGGPVLKNSDLVYSGTDRYRLRTVAVGKVYIQLGVVLRNFEKFGVES